VQEIDSMSWYPNRVGYIRRLYHLISLYLEFSFGLTHVEGIRKEINECVISM
jgi:hypothetical protein